MTPDETPIDQIAALGRYWDDVVRGGPAAANDLDPGLAATVRRLNALGADPAPDPVFAHRLWNGLVVSAQAAPAGESVATPNPSLSPNGRLGGAVRPWPRQGTSRIGRWSARLEGAAAVLLMVALTAGLIALNGRQPAGVEPFTTQQPLRTPFPAQLAQGEHGNPRDLPPTDGGLFETRLRRLTLQPGAVWNAPPGILLDHFVLTGLLTFRDAAMAPQEERAGRGASVAMDDLAMIVNDGDRVAVVLQLAIGPPPLQTASSNAVAIDDLGSGVVDPSLSRRATVGLGRVPVSQTPSAPIGLGTPAAPGSPGLALIAVESGTLELDARRGGVSLRRSGARDGTALAVLPPDTTGTVPTVRLGPGDQLTIDPGAIYGLRAVGPDVPIVAVATIEPAASADTSFLGGAQTLLRRGSVEFALRQIVLQPGARLEQAVSGTVLLEDVTGPVTARFEPATGSGGAGGAASGPDPARLDSVSGDGILIIGNSGAEPAELIMVVVSNAEAPMGVIAGFGAETTVLGTGSVDLPRAIRADISLVRQQVSGPVGGFSASMNATAGTDLTVVETGQLIFSRLLGDAAIQRWHGAAEATPVPAEALTSGAGVPFGVGDAALVRHPAAYSLWNPTASTASVLILNLSLGKAGAAPSGTPDPGEATPTADPAP